MSVNEQPLRTNAYTYSTHASTVRTVRRWQCKLRVRAVPMRSRGTGQNETDRSMSMVRIPRTHSVLLRFVFAFLLACLNTACHRTRKMSAEMSKKHNETNDELNMSRVLDSASTTCVALRPNKIVNPRTCAVCHVPRVPVDALMTRPRLFLPHYPLQDPTGITIIIILDFLTSTMIGYSSVAQ